MRVKIGDTWYNAKDTPICIQCDDREAQQIFDNPGDEGKYAQFPEDTKMDREQRMKWMEG